MYQQDWSNPEGAQSCYRTGFTEPKKPKRGILAAVLVLAIFLSGLNTTFRLLDIRLFRKITKDADIAPASVHFSPKSSAAGTKTPAVPALGISGEALSNFEQLYYNIPAGVYITEVAADSPANAAGIQPGDVLLYFNGVYTPDLENLKQKIAACNPKEKVCLLLHRKNFSYSVEIYLGE